MENAPHGISKGQGVFNCHWQIRLGRNFSDKLSQKLAPICQVCSQNQRGFKLVTFRQVSMGVVLHR